MTNEHIAQKVLLNHSFYLLYFVTWPTSKSKPLNDTLQNNKPTQFQRTPFYYLSICISKNKKLIKALVIFAPRLLIIHTFMFSNGSVLYE